MTGVQRIHAQRRHGRRIGRIALAVVIVTAAGGMGSAHAGAVRPDAPGPSFSISEFQPGLHATNRGAPADHAAYGGKVVAVDVADSTNELAVAAAESGGVFTTRDSGHTWVHADGLPPARLGDVRYAPGNSSVMIVTTQATGDARNPGGIWRSADAGSTWAPEGQRLCGADYNAWGIALNRDPSSGNIYVGTDCGIAASADQGVTWKLASPGPGLKVHSLIARGGTVDACVDTATGPGGGHYRYQFDGSNLTRQTGPDAIHPPVGRVPGSGCASEFGQIEPVVHDLTSAPQEPDVLLAMAAGASCALALYESDNGGQSWTRLFDDCDALPFIPWVSASPSSDGDPQHFDVYYSNKFRTHRITCTALVATPRCGSPVGSSVILSTAHPDHQGLGFAPGASCPRYLASDGGVQASLDCGMTYQMAAGSGAANGDFNALQLYDVTGEIFADHTDLYFGTQDNDVWASRDQGTTWPTEINGEFGLFQVPRIATTGSEFVTFTDGINLIGPAGLAGCANVLPSACSAWNNPPGPAAVGASGSGVASAPYVVGPGTYVQWTEPDSSKPLNQLNITTDFGTTWRAIPGAQVTGILMDRPFITGPVADPTIYQAFCTVCNSSPMSIQLKQIQFITRPFLSRANVRSANGILCPGSSVCLNTLGVFTNSPLGGFRNFQSPIGVDPNAVSHLIAADMAPGQKVMKTSRDGGLTWLVDRQLTDLVTDGGRFQFLTPNLGTEARIIAFDPTNGAHILVGTENAGIIASLDGGLTWSRVPGSERVTSVTAFFFNQRQFNPTTSQVLISTYGRGLWRLVLSGYLDTS